MIFEKPEDVRYTDMAIWIDENAYKSDCDDLVLYKYLYLLVEMLARKHKFFDKSSLYEDFSLYASNFLFQRIDKSRENPDKRIKSILNYLKASLFGLTKNFEKKNTYQQSDQIDRLMYDQSHIIGEYRCSQDFRGCEYTLGIKDLPRCVWETCKRTPYSSDKKVLTDMYTSVLLTILNQITLPTESLSKINRAINDDIYLSQRYICKLFQQEDPVESVILFHVPEEMRNYILFLANRSKKSIARDLSQIVQSWEPSDTIVLNLLQDQMESCIDADED